MKNSATHKIVMLVAAIVLIGVGVAGGYAWGAAGDGASPAASSVTAVSDRASATDHNARDVEFAQMMIPHHSQALEMAKLADTRAQSAGVKELAAKIEAAQQPEIEKMTGWLKSWNESTSTNMDHSGHDMNGMMSGGDMMSLKDKSGATFDKNFLEMMIKHHEGAITMAEDELKNGKNAEALALATSIQVTQQAEVNQMKSLLK